VGQSTDSDDFFSLDWNAPDDVGFAAVSNCGVPMKNKNYLCGGEILRRIPENFTFQDQLKWEFMSAVKLRSRRARSDLMSAAGCMNGR
jgi:hypothetical protein